MLVEQSLVSKKKNCKKDMVRPLSSSHRKMIFILLAKVITLYASLFLVDIKKPGFQRFFL